MELVKPDTYIDFMRVRKPVLGVSLVLVALSVISLFYPGPNFGIDFTGGTEIQLPFKGDVSSSEVRSALEAAGFSRPQVVAVGEAGAEYMIQVRESEVASSTQLSAVESGIKAAVSSELLGFSVSPSGDKVSLTFREDIDPTTLGAPFVSQGLAVRDAVRLGGGSREDFRYEVFLSGMADKVVASLTEALGERGPETPRRVEWVGPKAGAQLRSAGLQSLLYAIAFIMLYVAFRFDLRFAPGGVIAMLHDALITLGIFVLVRKEVNLTTVAALLAIIGYSINDTIVVYDRIRENISRHRKRTFIDIINLSTSQMLSRTLVTSMTTILSVVAFLFLGAGVLQDIAFALIVGVAVGTFSSVYIAAPTTEWIDRRFFRRSIAKQRAQAAA